MVRADNGERLTDNGRENSSQADGNGRKVSARYAKQTATAVNEATTLKCKTHKKLDEILKENSAKLKSINSHDDPGCP